MILLPQPCLIPHLKTKHFRFAIMHIGAFFESGWVGTHLQTHPSPSLQAPRHSIETSSGRNHLQKILHELNGLQYATATKIYASACQNQQPTYHYNSRSFPSHSDSTQSFWFTRSNKFQYVRSSLGKRAFFVISPRLWNSLPPDTRNSNSLPTFRSRLKTHLFKIAFPP